MPTYYVEKEFFKTVPPAQIKLFINAARDNGLKLLLALCWLTGARVTEVLSLKAGDFQIDNVACTVSVTIRAKKHGKLGYPTFSYSDDFVTELVLPAVQGKEYTTRLFFNGKRRYQQLLLSLNKQLNPTNKAEWLTFHYLRHSRITYLARNLQATPEELKGWTGHRSNAFDEYIASRKVKRFAGQLSQ